MIIRIKNLRLRTIIGIQDWERKERQDVVVNIDMEIDGSQAIKSDHIDDTIDYKVLTKRIIQEVENSQYYLLDRLAHFVLELVMAEDRVKHAVVEIEKPHALRYADSVSVVCSANREE